MVTQTHSSMKQVNMVLVHLIQPPCISLDSLTNVTLHFEHGILPVLLVYFILKEASAPPHHKSNLSVQTCAT